MDSSHIEPDYHKRFHGLDALRAMAMLLGIVLHAALPYMDGIPPEIWPQDKDSSDVIGLIFMFIHVWRMPVFFILAGFFANLVVTRRSWQAWWQGRLVRIGIPILVFSPIMSLTIPWVFGYGITREPNFLFSWEGQPYHLWFLWHLITFVFWVAILKLINRFVVGFFNLSDKIGVGIVRSYISYQIRITRYVLTTLYRITFASRFPLILIILCLVINFPAHGELIINPLASFVYFVFGYSLYRQIALLDFLKSYWRYYLAVGILLFVLYVVLESKSLTEKDYIQYSIGIACGVVFCFAFLGLAEDKFGSFDSRVRFISNGSYWTYMIHLPIVAIITFIMFELQIPAEIKFSIAIISTTGICLITYKYFVRYTFVGTMLNGRPRTPENSLTPMLAVQEDATRSPSVLWCSECGSNNPLMSKFCRMCGKNMEHS